MSIGEKISVKLHARNEKDKKEILNGSYIWRARRKDKLEKLEDEFNQDMTFLEETYNVILPKHYDDLDDEQLYVAMQDIGQGMLDSNCITKDRFMELFNETAEEALNVEPFSPTKTVITAYRRLQRQHHPDKNNGKDTGMSATINAAKEFLTEPEERKKYYFPADMK